MSLVPRVDVRVLMSELSEWSSWLGEDGRIDISGFVEEMANGTE